MRVPKKPSGRRALPFYWYRRFKTHKCLPYKYPLIDKIKNGDFDYSPYFQQAEWELHWMKDEQKEFIENYHGRDYLYPDVLVPLGPKVSIFASENLIKRFIFVLNEISPDQDWQDHGVDQKTNENGYSY